MPDDRIHLGYRAVGDPEDPPLLLLHGLTGSGRDWDGLTPAFAASWRTYAADLRGHGDSPKSPPYSFEVMRDDVIQLLDELGLERVTLVGHSLGAVLAYLLALKQPDRVHALVLEEPPPPVPLGRPLPERPREPSRYDWRAVVGIIAQLNEPDPAWWTDLVRIQAPTLLIGGGPTSHFPQDVLAEMAGRFPHGGLVTVPAGHPVHANAPEEFWAEAGPLLERHRRTWAPVTRGS